MKFYVRESTSEEYKLQKEDKPRGLSIYQMKPNDTWCSLTADYNIDEVNFVSTIVYATKTPLLKSRKFSFYREYNPTPKRKFKRTDFIEFFRKQINQKENITM